MNEAFLDKLTAWASSGGASARRRTPSRLVRRRPRPGNETILDKVAGLKVMLEEELAEPAPCRSRARGAVAAGARRAPRAS